MRGGDYLNSTIALRSLYRLLRLQCAIDIMGVAVPFVGIKNLLWNALYAGTVEQSRSSYCDVIIALVTLDGPILAM